MNVAAPIHQRSLFDNPADDDPADVDEQLPLRATTFCVIDLETTGTMTTSRITEIGAVKVRGGEVLGQFHTLVNPGVAIPGVVADLTGISNATVAGAPHLRQVFPSLIEFCRGCVMVAHNARFDMGFLTRACTNLGYDWPSPVCLDTVRLARHIIPRREVANYRLGTLAAYFSTATEPSHRALDDARATVEVLHALLERVGNQSVATLADLLAYSHTVSPARRARRVWADDLPDTPGVYLFVRDDRQGRHYLYVGVSQHIRRRVAAYFTAGETRQRMEEMVRLSTGVEAIECATGLQAAVVESRLIKAHQPPYNRRGKQPHHTWIKVTIEPIPRLSVVRRILGDQAVYCGPFSGRAPAEDAILAIGQAFSLRSCTDRLSVTTGRPACSLAELASCPAPCTLAHLDDYRRVVDQVKDCLAGDVRPVAQACLTAMAHLSAQLRYEQAGELLQRWRVFEQAMRRQARLTSLANCPHIVAARRLETGWELHVIRYARLAGAGVARPGDDPLEVVAAVLATAQTVEPAVAGLPAGSIEEAELIATWLEQPGVRLIDIQGVWGWPVHAQ